MVLLSVNTVCNTLKYTGTLHKLYNISGAGQNWQALSLSYSGNELDNKLIREITLGNSPKCCFVVTVKLVA